MARTAKSMLMIMEMIRARMRMGAVGIGDVRDFWEEAGFGLGLALGVAFALAAAFARLARACFVKPFNFRSSFCRLDR